MEVVRPFEPPIDLIRIPLKPEPVADPPKPQEDPRPRASRIDQLPRVIPIPSEDGPAVDATPDPLPPFDPLVGKAIDPLPPPIINPVRMGPRFVTPAHAVRPPYPEARRLQEQEASLRLRLTIDARGRVTSVEPVGSADPVFLDAARRHIIARWRYKPASEDGRPVASSTVITLRFELD
jgi:periplasmic protein TonB